MKFTELDIHPDLIRAATESGFEELTSIQEQCLFPGLEGRDIAGISQTGTGKTVAFLLPILNKIFSENLPGIAALIVTPTRELCLQITEEAEKLCRHHAIKVSAIYGGEGYVRQEEELRQNPELVVATPGRLIDYMKQKKFEIGNLKFLVLDEADRMFDMGFIRDVRYIMKYAPEGTQTMLFSATLSYYVMRLASDYMHDPVEVRIESDSVAVDRIEQALLHLGRNEKLPYLVNHILTTENMKGIVFTNTRNMVERIVRELRRYGIAATGISSLLDQKKRIRLLKNFKLGKYDILVATDVASRGLDVDDITHVFNYDLPQDGESYVHRIGRTARAGRSGHSITFCSEDDYDSLPRIHRYLGEKIPVAEVKIDMIHYPEGEFTPFKDIHEGERQERGEGRREGGEGGEGRGRRRRRSRKPSQGREGAPEGQSRREERPAAFSSGMESPRETGGTSGGEERGGDRSRRRGRGRRGGRDRAPGAEKLPVIPSSEAGDSAGSTVRDIDRAALLSGANTAAARGPASPERSAGGGGRGRGRRRDRRGGERGNRSERPERAQGTDRGEGREDRQGRERRDDRGERPERRGPGADRWESREDRQGRGRDDRAERGERQGQGSRRRGDDRRDRDRDRDRSGGGRQGGGQGRGRGGRDSRERRPERSRAPQKKGIISKILSIFKKK